MGLLLPVGSALRKQILLQRSRGRQLLHVGLRLYLVDDVLLEGGVLFDCHRYDGVRHLGRQG